MLIEQGLKTEYKPVELIKNLTYKVRWGFSPVLDEDGNETDEATWVSELVFRKPSLQQVKKLILDYYNNQVDNIILSGFNWKEMKVWLSTENQFNYKAAYDLAVQTQGANLPIMFKFGTADEPKYYTFETLEDLTDFYTSAMNHINNALVEGWKKKDAVNWEDYK